MTVFTWMVILILLAAVLFKNNTKNRKMFIFVAFFLLFCVMGLRDVNTGGNDSSGTGGSYPGIYQSYGKMDLDEIIGNNTDSFNVGFGVLNKIIYLITDGNYQTYITIISFFVIFSYMRFINKYSPNPLQSVLMFLGLLYYILLFDALKQAIAMSVLLYAFDAIIEKRPIKFILIVILAGLFHFPALVFLPAYWIGRMKIGRSYVILLAILLTMTFLFRDQILSLMLSAYNGNEIEASMEGIRFLRNKAIIMIVIVVVATVLRPPTVEDKVYKACLFFAGIAIVFQTFCGYNNTFERLADYYFHTSIIFIPLVFERCDLKRHVIAIGTELSVKKYAPILFCGFAIWRFLSYVNNSQFYMYYKFLWQ